MKQYTVYVCETCGYESRSCDEMREHEATHLKLTKDELNEYKNLQYYARCMGVRVSHTNNVITRDRFDKAIEDLVVFEKEHGLCK